MAKNKNTYLVIYIIDSLIEKIESTKSVMIAKELFKQYAQVINPELKGKAMTEAVKAGVYANDINDLSSILNDMSVNLVTLEEK
jgi:hypothetical protein